MTPVVKKPENLPDIEKDGKTVRETERNRESVREREKDIYVTSFSVFYIESPVSIGLKNVFRMVTSILQN